MIGKRLQLLNSEKAMSNTHHVNTITAHRFNTVLRRTDECVEIA